MRKIFFIFSIIFLLLLNCAAVSLRSPKNNRRQPHSAQGYNKQSRRISQINAKGSKGSGLANISLVRLKSASGQYLMISKFVNMRLQTAFTATQIYLSDDKKNKFSDRLQLIQYKDNPDYCSIKSGHGIGRIYLSVSMNSAFFGQLALLEMAGYQYIFYCKIGQGKLVLQTQKLTKQCESLNQESLLKCDKNQPQQVLTALYKEKFNDSELSYVNWQSSFKHRLESNKTKREQLINSQTWSYQTAQKHSPILPFHQ